MELVELLALPDAAGELARGAARGLRRHRLRTLLAVHAAATSASREGPTPSANGQ